MRSTRWLPALLLLSLAACGPGFVNQPLGSLQLPLEQRPRNVNLQTESFVQAQPMPDARPSLLVTAASSPATAPSTPSGCFVGLAISGGGSRSANFAAACMFQLQRIGLLQKVDCISAVSGGSFAAAYYCTCPDEQWTPGIVQQKLTHPFASDIIGDVLLPWNFVGLMIGSLTRSDILAGDIGQVLFTRHGRGLTFGDLRPDRPRLLINSTELETGTQFVFDNSHFDLLNSNLNRYPLAYAVTASSAVPLVMHPVPIHDFSTQFPRDYHLVDGGICDNLAVQTLVESYDAQIQNPVNPYPRGGIIIIIDADVPNIPITTHTGLAEVIFNLFASLQVAGGVLVDRASAATLSQLVLLHADGRYSAADLRRIAEQFRRDHTVEVNDRVGHPLRVFHISLQQVSELSDANLAGSVNRIPTDFDISKDQAYDLYKSAEILFRQRFDAKLIPLTAQLH